MSKRQLPQSRPGLTCNHRCRHKEKCCARPRQLCGRSSALLLPGASHDTVVWWDKGTLERRLHHPGCRSSEAGNILNFPTGQKHNVLVLERRQRPQHSNRKPVPVFLRKDLREVAYRSNQGSLGGRTAQNHADQQEQPEPEPNTTPCITLQYSLAANLMLVRCCSGKVWVGSLDAMRSEIKRKAVLKFNSRATLTLLANARANFALRT